MPEVADKPLRQLAESLSGWRIAPSGTEGWKKAEVMSGGVDTRDIDSKTLESKRAPGLHFITFNFSKATREVMAELSLPSRV